MIPQHGPFLVAYKTKTTFVNDVVAAYPAAGTASAKLQFALKQAWYANHGNGFEIYNTFRRTGYPNDLQAPLQAPRQFALSLPYAQDELNLNPIHQPRFMIVLRMQFSGMFLSTSFN